MSTVKELIELAKNNYYGIKNGGEISELMKQNFELTTDRLKEHGIKVVLPELWSPFDEKFMEPVSVEYLPEVEWFKHNELVMDVLTPGFYDEVANRLIEPAKVKVGAGTRELRWKFLLNYGNVPGVEYNLVLIKSPQELYEIFGVDGLEGVKEVLKKETEEWFSGEEEKENREVFVSYVEGIRNEETATKLADMMARYFRGSLIAKEDLSVLNGPINALWQSVKAYAEQHGVSFDEELKTDVIYGWEVLLSAPLPDTSTGLVNGA